MDSYEGALEVELRIQFHLEKPISSKVPVELYSTQLLRWVHWFPVGEFRSSLEEFLEEWQRDSQFVPANLLEGSDELVKRKPEFLELDALRQSTFHAIVDVVQILDFILNSDNELDSDAVFNKVVIESLEYGSVTGKIFLSAAFALDLLSNIITVDSYVFRDIPYHFDRTVGAECSIYAMEEENLAKLILQKLNSNAKSFIDQANNSCVELRQQALNHFVDQQIAVDGLYGDETMNAEDRVRKQLGVKVEEDSLLLYRAMVKVLMQPRLNIKIPSDLRSSIEVKTNSFLGKVYPSKKPSTNSDTTFTPK